MKLRLVLDNVRSAHNVGSIARTAYGFNIASIITVGITPHMAQIGDERLPHVILRAEKEIKKTALGGEVLLGAHYDSIEAFLASFDTSQSLVALELTDNATEISGYNATTDTALVLGNEVTGVSRELLTAAEAHLYIPISENKESYNVGSAGAIAMYALHTQFATL